MLEVFDSTASIVTLYIYLFAVYHYAQTWGIGLQSLASILPACPTENE